MKKPDIEKLRAEFKRREESEKGSVMPEYHQLEIWMGEDDDSECYESQFIDFHGKDTSWCAMRLNNFPYLDKWTEDDWADKTLVYNIENKFGYVDSEHMEPWFIDEENGIIYFKKTE